MPPGTVMQFRGFGILTTERRRAKNAGGVKSGISHCHFADRFLNSDRQNCNSPYCRSASLRKA